MCPCNKILCNMQHFHVLHKWNLFKIPCLLTTFSAFVLYYIIIILNIFMIDA